MAFAPGFPLRQASEEQCAKKHGSIVIEELCSFTAALTSLDGVTFDFPHENPYYIAKAVWGYSLHRAVDTIGWPSLSEGGAEAVEWRDECWRWRLELQRKDAEAKARRNNGPK